MRGGEGGRASYDVIADTFPPYRRARALAVYALGIMLGSAAGVVLGGYIATLVDWRTAFVVVGVAGVVLAPVFRLSVREPIHSIDASDREPVRRVFGVLGDRLGARDRRMYARIPAIAFVIAAHRSPPVSCHCR